MTFEEFKNNLDELRKYNKKLSKYKVSFFYDEISQAAKRQGFFIPEQTSKDKRKEYKRRKRNIEKIELPQHLIDFEWLIAGIIHGVINVEKENDWMDDEITITKNESGQDQITYKANSRNVLGRSASVPYFEDTETNRTFKILKYYYLEGYTVEHIATLFNYGVDPQTPNRDGVYYQIDKGVKELYQIYIERSQNK